MNVMPPEEHDLEFVYDPDDDYEEHAYCNTCGAHGEELLTWCPGVSLTDEALDACTKGGNVTDLEQWRRHKGKPPSPIFEEGEEEGEVGGW